MAHSHTSWFTESMLRRVVCALCVIAAVSLVVGHFNPRLAAYRLWHLLLFAVSVLFLAWDGWRMWRYVVRTRGRTRAAFAEWLRFTWVDWMDPHEMAETYVQLARVRLTQAETQLAAIRRLVARERRMIKGLEVRLHKRLDKAGYVPGTLEWPVHRMASALFGEHGPQIAFRYVRWACMMRPTLDRINRCPLNDAQREAVVTLLLNADAAGLNRLTEQIAAAVRPIQHEARATETTRNPEELRRVREITALVHREERLPVAKRTDEMTSLRMCLQGAADPAAVRARQYRLWRHAYEQAITTAEETASISVRA